VNSDYSIGIDLGTTNSLCAVWEHGTAAPKIFPITQPYDDLSQGGFKRDSVLPSSVAILPDGVFVGFAAKQYGRMGRGTVINSVKRHMGTHWSREVQGRTWTPEAISGCILKAIRCELDLNFLKQPRQVVITVPASFGTEARRATLLAARLAGFDPKTTRLFDEPAAALINQLQSEREISLNPRTQRLMLIDIGGGTLDVSYIQLSREGDELVADIQGRSRYNELAGDDFDLNIAGLLLSRYEDEFPRIVDDATRDARRILFYEMLLRAEEVKKRLSQAAAGRPRSEFSRISESVVLNYTPDNRRWSTTLNLDDLASELKPFFPFSADEDERRQDYSFFKPIQQCLDSVALVTGQRFSGHEVDEVYLAGGSSLLPMVSSAVQRILSQKPKVVANPMDAIALGAAWYAGILQGYLNERLSVQERLFDGLFLQIEAGNFVQLLSSQEKVPLAKRRLEHVLTLTQHDRRIEVALFMGTGLDDPHMVPLARRRVDFGTLLPPGHPIHLTVCVTENRQVEFEFSSEFHGRVLQGQIEVSACLGWEREDALGLALPEVNLPLAGGGV